MIIWVFWIYDICRIVYVPFSHLLTTTKSTTLKCIWHQIYLLICLRACRCTAVAHGDGVPASHNQHNRGLSSFVDIIYVLKLVYYPKHQSFMNPLSNHIRQLNIPIQCQKSLEVISIFSSHILFHQSYLSTTTVNNSHSNRQICFPKPPQSLLYCPHRVSNLGLGSSVIFAALGGLPTIGQKCWRTIWTTPSTLSHLAAPSSFSHQDLSIANHLVTGKTSSSKIWHNHWKLEDCYRETTKATQKKPKAGAMTTHRNAKPLSVRLRLSI